MIKNKTILATKTRILKQGSRSERSNTKNIVKHANSGQGKMKTSPATKITPNSANERSQNLLKNIVEKLDTSTHPPEDEVIRQDDFKIEQNAMYFVGQGDCKVKVRE